jgi:hypothetical protein
MNQHESTTMDKKEDVPQENPKLDISTSIRAPSRDLNSTVILDHPANKPVVNQKKRAGNDIRTMMSTSKTEDRTVITKNSGRSVSFAEPMLSPSAKSNDGRNAQLSINMARFTFNKDDDKKRPPNIDTSKPVATKRSEPMITPRDTSRYGIASVETIKMFTMTDDTDIDDETLEILGMTRSEYNTMQGIENPPDAERQEYMNQDAPHGRFSGAHMKGRPKPVPLAQRIGPNSEGTALVVHDKKYSPGEDFYKVDSSQDNDNEWDEWE